MAERITWQATEAGRLDKVVADGIDSVTRSYVQTLISAGNVSVDQTVQTKNGFAVRVGQTLTVFLPDPVTVSSEGEDIPIDIVYEDEDMMVINKQQGLVVHPSPSTPSGTLVNALMFIRQRFSTINGVVRPGIVHRIDKNTSGLLVVAKNDRAHLSLAEQIATKTATRCYLALVDGNIKQDSGTICQPIGRHPKERKQMAVVPTGRVAITHFRVEERFGDYTLVHFQLETGRTHQIRVHSRFINHPVVGDDVYGGSNKFALSGQLLHAYQLSLNQPSTGERLTFTAPLPDYFQAVLVKLRAKANR